MPAAKLTLSADKDLIERAKELASEEGTSLSSMFARFLEARLRGQRKRPEAGPLTRKATGLVSLPAGKTDRELLEDALAKEHADAIPTQHRHLQS